MQPIKDWMIQLLPPSFSQCVTESVATKFVHTSTNKIRCPINVVKVRQHSNPLDFHSRHLVESRWKAPSHRLNVGWIHTMERIDVQLWNNYASARIGSSLHGLEQEWSMDGHLRPQRLDQILAVQHEQFEIMAGPQGTH